MLSKANFSFLFVKRSISKTQISLRVTVVPETLVHLGMKVISFNEEIKS